MKLLEHKTQAEDTYTSVHRRYLLPMLHYDLLLTHC